MSKVAEIEAALKELSLQDAKSIARWLRDYLDQQSITKTQAGTAAAIKQPDYARRRRMIFGDKTLPNMVMLGREEERW